MYINAVKFETRGLATFLLFVATACFGPTNQNHQPRINLLSSKKNKQTNTMTDHDRGGSLDALSAEIGATFLSSLKGKNDLDEYEGSLAMTLLRSSDEKVVAAAKRIFFTALAKEETCLPSKVCQKTALENKNRATDEPMADEIPSSTLCLNGPILNTSSTASTDRSQIPIPKPTPTGFSIHVSKRSKSPTHKPISETKKKTAPSDRMERR